MLLTTGVVEAVDDSTGLVVVPSVAESVVDPVVDGVVLTDDSVVVVECPSVLVEPPVTGKVKDGRFKLVEVLGVTLEVAISGVVVLEAAGVVVVWSDVLVKSKGVEDASGVVFSCGVVSIAGAVVVVFSDVASVVLATSVAEDHPCQPSLFSLTAPKG